MMNREDIRQLGLGLIKEFIRRPLNDGFRYLLRVTSGTSGVPLFFLQRQNQAKDWFKGKVRPLHCFGTRNSRLNATLLARYAEAPDIRMFSLDSSDVDQDLGPLLEDFRPTSFEGFPAFNERVGRQLSISVREAVERVFWAGEYMTEEKMARLKQLFPRAAFSWQYVMTEVGFITKESCRYLPLNHYHPESGMHIEIVSPDERGYGEIAVSTSIGIAPIEGYRSGDTGRFVATSCPCGELLTLEVIGRDGFDYVKLLGAVVRREVMDRVLEKRKAEFDDWRLEAQELLVGGVTKGKLHLSLYRKGPIPSAARIEELREAISNELFLTPTRTLSALVRDDLFCPLDLVYCDAPFPTGHKDIKIRIRR